MHGLLSRIVVMAVVVVTSSTLVGCQEKGGARGSGSAAPAAAPLATAAAPKTPPFRETWESHYLQGTKVGYGRTAYYRDELNGKPVVRIVSEAVLTVLRFKQKFEQKYRDVSWESETGDVIRFETQTEMGDLPTTMIGTVEGDRATLVVQTAGKVTSDTIAWPKGTGGSTAAPDSLRRKPMQPGETRTITSFLPLFNRVAVNTLTARAKETIDVDGASRELLRIESSQQVDPQTKIDLTLWTDDQGEIWKLDLPLIQQVTVRTTPERARAQGDAPPVDLGKSTLVRVDPPLKNAHTTQQVRYRVTVQGSDVAKVFPASEGQTVALSSEPGIGEVTVTAVRPTTPLPAGFQSTPPTDRDQKPNSVIQSDDAEVAKLAAAAAGDETDPWRVALRLESFVREKMNAAALGAGFDFSKAFATAAETARTLKGDCTEHAVLLCAMLRARGIPARTVMGLVYVDRDQSFGYHLWTEAFIGDRWIPLDATVGQGGTSAAYLKLVDANLDGIDSFTAFLPLLNVVGRLKVEVLEQR